MASLLQGELLIDGRPPEGDCKPPQAADFAATHASGFCPFAGSGHGRGSKSASFHYRE
jgi:hypothetical protein